jgi:hypothetical protein
MTDTDSDLRALAEKADLGPPLRVEPMRGSPTFFNGPNGEVWHYNIFAHAADDEDPEVGETRLTTSGRNGEAIAAYIVAACYLREFWPDLILRLDKAEADKAAAHARAEEREHEIDRLEGMLTVGSLTMALCQSGVVSKRDQRSPRDLPKRYAAALLAALTSTDKETQG